MDSTQKAKETHERNQAARIAKIREQQMANAAARLALTKVFQAPDATPEQVLRAAELLAGLGKY